MFDGRFTAGVSETPDRNNGPFSGLNWGPGVSVGSGETAHSNISSEFCDELDEAQKPVYCVGFEL